MRLDTFSIGTAPTYSEAEWAAMRRAATQEHKQQRLLAQQSAFAGIDPTPPLGAEQSSIVKFTQDQCDIHVFIALPSATTPTSALRVDITRQSLSVVVNTPKGPSTLVGGTLWSPVEPAECHWQRTDDLVEVTLAKVYRRGRYPLGGSLADTWWWGLLAGGPRIQGQYPPAAYYAAYGGDGRPMHRAPHALINRASAQSLINNH